MLPQTLKSSNTIFCICVIYITCFEQCYTLWDCRVHSLSLEDLVMQPPPYQHFLSQAHPWQDDERSEKRYRSNKIKYSANYCMYFELTDKGTIFSCFVYKNRKSYEFIYFSLMKMTYAKIWRIFRVWLGLEPWFLTSNWLKIWIRNN